CALNSTLLLLLIVFAITRGRSYPHFSRNDTEFQHLVLHPDPSLGTVYVGARDHLFQLDGADGLRLELEEKTGPVSDSKDCLPPVTESNCPQARRTSNHNKLLLVDPKALELITCGSIHQGTCQKRSLASIQAVRFSTERPVDTQYVAANDPLVSTVGLVVGLRGERTVMYVGRGYTASHPPISTRHLSVEPIFSYEETAKLAVAGRLSEYDHHFVKAFTRRSYVYFLFYRRDIKSPSREYRTYAARVCLDDTSYYSYVEVPLVCRSWVCVHFVVFPWFLLQQVGQGVDREGEDLLGVFSSRVGPTNNAALDASALCVYPLDELDGHIDSTRNLCYTQDGRVEGRGEVAYIEYDVKSSCANLPMNTLKAYPCGSDHTPSPMASRAPLEARAAWHTSAARLTAVAVSVRDGHSIAFLGDSRGTLHKVYLGQDGQAEVYANTTIQLNSPINGDLLLDRTGAHIYVMTRTTVKKLPVAECGDHLDCQSCLSANDPYCGWCVLEGRCGQRRECQRGSVQGQWLWSFNRTQQCLSIQRLSLYNISRGEKTDITVSVEGLPGLGEGEAYSCFFQDTERPNSPSTTAARCSSSPDAGRESTHQCIAQWSVCYCHLCFCLALSDLTCAMCSARCQGCVSSRWGCSWCIHQHVCTHKRTLTLFNCSVGRSDCSRCRTADPKYGCVWCAGVSGSRCVYRDSCAEEVKHTCPAPVIHYLDPVSGPVEGGTVVTISGSNLGQRAVDIQQSVLVAGVPCSVIHSRYEVSSRRVLCISLLIVRLPVFSSSFHYQDPVLSGVFPQRGPKAGGSSLTIRGRRLRTGHPSEVGVLIGGVPCVVEWFSPPPSGGRIIRVSGQNLDVVQEPKMRVTFSPPDTLPPRRKRSKRRSEGRDRPGPVKRWRRIVPEAECPEGTLCHVKQVRSIQLCASGENLDLAIYKQEVEARIGAGLCSVKTLTHNHLYCEPPAQQPSVTAGKRQEGLDSLPEFTVRMGNLNFSLGRVQYDRQAQSTFPLEAQVGVGVGASIVALIVLMIVLIYRRKSKQAMRDYKKVQIQLENLETSVRDRCKKEFTDLMTEMMDMSSDLVGSGIPILDYRAYAERIFFPGHQESPLRRDLDVPESRRQTVEQGLVQLSNLLNSKLFLTKFIHTLEVQRTFSPRDRAYVASLLTVALHGKLEYFTDILKTLLNDLVEQYVAKNPKLMLRRTESVVEKLLTNWMSICLFTFLRESAGESFYMLFRAIKHQVDKGPVDAVTGKAKYTLNDNRLLREDVEYRTLTLNVATATVPAKVLDCDTITQVKEKLLEQTWKGTSFSLRPHVDSLHLEWRAGVAGHLILSDEDLTSVVQGSWKRLNTLQHYKVGASHSIAKTCTQTPMLDDGEEGGVRLWHLVKAGEESELPNHRRGSVRERGGERAKAIPEIYLTRLLSMKGTLQKFVDDLFTAILSTSRPVPLAVKYFFDLLDEQALQHNITDPETIHIWKTNSLPLRFWINILKNPQFIFDVQTSDHVDAVLSVIAQTFMDSCTIADHKLGRDSPINKLLYARDIPRYKQMPDVSAPVCVSTLTKQNYAAEVNSLVALHELYKYINKYYDQIITALEEDATAQKMQLGYRLQQIAAAVENKVTDL
uniref:Plexin-B1 n=1 Tax=Gasterosteus aculeatus aculeatus TaxID=481459 RepID=A0AAQ4RTT6_GASAC